MDVWKQLDKLYINYVKQKLMDIHENDNNCDNDFNDNCDTNKINNNNPNQINNNITDKIIQLPIKLGGLGLILHSDTYDTIRISALSLSDNILNGIPKDNLPSLKEQLNDLHQSLQNKLIQQLSQDEAIQFVDMNSTIYKKWLISIPRYNILRINDPQVASYLKAKTLYRSNRNNNNNNNNKNNNNNNNTCCSNCGLINVPINHPEICSESSNYKVARHEMIKRCLAKHLISIGNEVHIEPFSNTTSRHRADLRITGPSTPRQVTCDIDVTVNTTQSKYNNNKNKNNQINKSSDISISEIEQMILSDLNNRFDEKNKKYKNKTNTVYSTSTSISTSTIPVISTSTTSNTPVIYFSALTIPWCISAAGYLHPSALSLLSNIKKNIIPELSIIMTKSRFMNSRSIRNTYNKKHLLHFHQNSITNKQVDYNQAFNKPIYTTINMEDEEEEEIENTYGNNNKEVTEDKTERLYGNINKEIIKNIYGNNSKEESNNNNNNNSSNSSNNSSKHQQEVETEADSSELLEL